MADWPPPDDGKLPPRVTKGITIDVFEFGDVKVSLHRDHLAESDLVHIAIARLAPPRGHFVSLGITPEQAVALGKALKAIGS